MAVSNKFSCSCSNSKSPKKPFPVRSICKLIRNWLAPFRELMNLKMQEYNYSFVLRTDWQEDVSILASTLKPEETRMWGCEDTNKRIWTEDMRMWGCKYTSKHTWTWRYEDVWMRGYQQAHMNWRYEDVKMQGYKQAHMNLKIWGCEDARIQASTHEPEDMRMWGCKYTSKHT